MAGVGHRDKIYSGDEVVAIPATKTAAAVTITGTSLYPYEATGFGGATVTLEVGDTEDVGDTITMKTYVSFDEGVSWVQVDQDATIIAGDASTTFRRIYIPFAPRLKVDAVFDAAATLSTGHGAEVNVQMVENDPEAARTFHEDVLSFGDSQNDGDSLIAAIDGDTMVVNNPNKITVWCGMVDRSTIGDTFYDINLQGSIDASNWYTIVDLATALPENGTGYANYFEEIERLDFPKYLRLQFGGGDSFSYWTLGHGIKYYVLAQE